ncbi:MAG: hypothetical protein AB1896_21270, partial [Thermodesulfobacteriota bacterium]
VVLPETGFEFKTRFDQGPVYTDSPLQGTHTFEDAFFLVRDFGDKEKAPPAEDITALGRRLFSVYNF